MHTIEVKKYLLRLLTGVKLVLGEDGSQYGLCHLLSKEDDRRCEDEDRVCWGDVGAYKDHLFHQWPEFSGRSNYPVTVAFDDLPDEDLAIIADRNESDHGDPIDWGDPCDVAAAIFSAVDYGDLYDGNYWDAGTLYGAARHRLLDWMIEKVKEDIANEV